MALKREASPRMGQYLISNVSMMGLSTERRMFKCMMEKARQLNYDGKQSSTVERRNLESLTVAMQSSVSKTFL